jgi:hypothetical protein
METLNMNDTFVFDIGVNDIDGNPDTPKLPFMTDHTDTDIFDFFSEAQQDVEPIDIAGFFSDMATEPMAMEPFDYLKPFENNQDVFGEYFYASYYYNMGYYRVQFPSNSTAITGSLYLYYSFLFVMLVMLVMQVMLSLQIKR